MTKTRARCRAAFEKGQMQRAAYPLPFGDYKLREALSRMEQYLSDLDDIAARELAKQAGVPQQLRLKMPDGGDGWIKRIPEAIAFDFGHNVTPGVEALSGQGLPRARVGQLAVIARATAENLVIRCDAVRNQLESQGIGLELAQMSHGGSLVRPLLLDAIDLIQRMLDEVTAYTPTT